MTSLAVTRLDPLNTTRPSSPSARCASVGLAGQVTLPSPQSGWMTLPLLLQVTCVGHIVGAVVADTQLHAQRAAKAVRIQYEELQPVVTIQVRPVKPVASQFG